MPQVPTFGGAQVRDTALGTPYASMPAGDGGARAVAGGLSAADQAVTRIVDQNDRDVAFRTEAKIKEDFVKFELDARNKAQGRDAVGYADAIKGWWDKAGEEAGKDLTRSQQAIVGRSLMSARGQSYEGALKHEMQERDRSEIESYHAVQLAEIQRGSAAGDPAVAAASVDLLKQRNAEFAAQKGYTPERLQQLNLKDTTALHVNVINSLQQSDPKAAVSYFNANKADIDGTKHDEITRSLGKITAATDGQALADSVWQAKGPKSYNQPIDRPAMEDEARKKFANDPVRLTAALTAIKERTAAFNEAEKEFNAGNVNAVMAAYAQHAPSMAQLERLPAYQALPGKEQATIRDRVESNLATRASRAAAEASRADSAESRAERALTRKGNAEYLRLSDPAVLSTMTEAQVQAQLPTLGPQLTNHLVEKFRSTKNDPNKQAEWKMDNDDFNHVANTMGLKPFDKKTDEEKAALGEVKYRVEQVIGVAQKAKGKALTRDEKSELMRQELARTVKTGGFLGFFESEKPVIGLTPAEIADVNVPANERAQITAAMEKRFAATGDAQFKPTEDNVRRLYLRGRSRSADFLTQPNGDK